MSLTTLTPSGRILVKEPVQATLPLPREIEEAFALSNSTGLIELLKFESSVLLDAELLSWRAFGSHVLSQVTRETHGSDDEGPTLFAALEPTDDNGESDPWIATWIEAAPPFWGSEYLTPSTATGIAMELRSTIESQAKQHDGGMQGWLGMLPGHWKLVGRITFHLAENKRDAARPFAFMATYVNRVSRTSRAKHLPLGQALKQYAGEGNRQQMTSLLNPVRAAAKKSPLCRRLLDNRTVFQPQAWTIQEAHQFLTSVPEMESAGLVVRVPDWWNPRHPTQPQVQVQLGKKIKKRKDAPDWLDFSVSMAIDGEPLTEAEQAEILASTEGLIKLRGKWVHIDSERLQEALDHWESLESEHAHGIDFIAGMRMLAGVVDESLGAEDEDRHWAGVVAGPELKKLLQQLKDPTIQSEFQPGVGLNGTLRPYQVDGVRWLHLLRRLRLGGCLADDMGLGKTIQVLDLLQQEHTRITGSKKNTGPPSLLLVPASLLGNWRHESDKFAPKLRMRIAHRSEGDWELLELLSSAEHQAIPNCDVVVTTYSMVRRLVGIKSRKWRVLILDEAQAIKNAASKLSRAIRKLDAETRFAMTGTPIENQVGDLWSLFDFCSPGLLGTQSGFKKTMERLNKQSNNAAYAVVRKLVRPYILRRLKTDPAIALDLPDKIEMRTECLLSRKQATLYEKTIVELAERLEDTDGMQRRGLVLGALMQLKQICNHPDQFLGCSQFEPKESGKFERLAETCEPIRLRQERLLLFTQFQSMTQTLGEYLETIFGRRGLILDGKTPVKRRKQLVAEFQSDDGPPFFVISVKAGGVGLNLTAASHVIHFDRWWNPAVENQATDRAFRIGQHRNVFVHKFVCRGTLEERINQILENKQALSDKILDTDGQVILTEMSNEQFLQFVSLDFDRAIDAI